MCAGNTVFLVIYGLKDDGLTLREVGVYDRDGEYVSVCVCVIGTRVYVCMIGTCVYVCACVR